jgi:RimJ/RimL family protein N-acetyltransferase
MIPIPLDTARLRLDPLTEDDSDFLAELLNDPGFLRYIGDRGVRTPADSVTYLRNGPWAMYDKHGFGLLRVSLRDSGEKIGMCGLLQRDWLEVPDIGFSFLQRHCASGYGRESAHAVLDDAAARLGVLQVGAIVAPYNVASINLLEKLGFTYRKPVTPPGEERELAFYLREA